MPGHMLIKSISLPVHSNLNNKMIKYISQIIKDNA